MTPSTKNQKISGYAYLGLNSCLRIQAQISESEQTIILLGTKGTNQVITSGSSWGITWDALLANESNNVEFQYVKSRDVVKIKDKAHNLTFEMSMEELWDLWVYEKEVGIVKGKLGMKMSDNNMRIISHAFVNGAPKAE